VPRIGGRITAVLLMLIAISPMRYRRTRRSTSSWIVRVPEGMERVQQSVVAAVRAGARLGARSDNH
jgi:hypothetical protein